jgi:ureidoacrylate peracid hydrolase
MNSYQKLLSETKRGQKNIELAAKPEPIQIDLHKSALVVVDMQNAFCTEGGMFEQSGVNVKPIQKIIKPCAKLLTAMRRTGCKIIYLQMGFDPDLHACGGSNSPYWYKSKALKLMRNRPDLLDGKPLVLGTHDSEIISELSPHREDIIIKKQRYSGFYGTDLEQTLFTYAIKYLIFVGVATNVCVESTLRDAFFRNYFPIIVSDGVHHEGPTFCQEATLYNIQKYFGWVTTTRHIIEALSKLGRY